MSGSRKISEVIKNLISTKENTNSRVIISNSGVSLNLDASKGAYVASANEVNRIFDKVSVAIKNKANKE